MDAPIPLNTFESAPLKNAFYPSDLAILTIQSKVLLYKISALPINIVINIIPDCIIIRLLTVSKGYEITPAVAVMA